MFHPWSRTGSSPWIFFLQNIEKKKQNILYILTLQLWCKGRIVCACFIADPPYFLDLTHAILLHPDMFRVKPIPIFKKIFLSYSELLGNRWHYLIFFLDLKCCFVALRSLFLWLPQKIVVDFCKVLPFKAGISFPMALGHSFLRFSYDNSKQNMEYWITKVMKNPICR